MSNVMATSRNIGGANDERKFRNSLLCLTPQSLADAHCSSAVQKRCQQAHRRTQDLDAK